MSARPVAGGARGRLVRGGRGARQRSVGRTGPRARRHGPFVSRPALPLSPKVDCRRMALRTPNTSACGADSTACRRHRRAARLRQRAAPPACRGSGRARTPSAAVPLSQPYSAARRRLAGRTVAPLGRCVCHHLLPFRRRSHRRFCFPRQAAPGPQRRRRNPAGHARPVGERRDSHRSHWQDRSRKGSTRVSRVRAVAGEGPSAVPVCDRRRSSFRRPRLPALPALARPFGCRFAGRVRRMARRCVGRDARSRSRGGALDSRSRHAPRPSGSVRRGRPRRRLPDRRHPRSYRRWGDGFSRRPAHAE